MKTIIKDLTGEMPVQDIDEKLGIILMKHYKGNDYITDDAIKAIKSLFADKPKGKPIELVKVITVDGNVTGSELTPSEMKSITLLCRNYGGGFDAMFAEGIGGVPLLYLGHWNGGFIEDYADTHARQMAVHKIGDGRIIYNGETYVNEKSKRVMDCDTFTATDRKEDKG